ncbi:M50 family metallopeptidase [Nocardioides aurantiacus]|uniref:Membrane-associated protease RseP (Regulator of RpoE activity) n=1 Tax=Nocardioides aurantiacus TaxID=86796 RepID=A0A3N2CY27_9ACTN|nr:site-2 protease family protein [Nocardioides aurantiacus]ROR92114.1 membrane-associated protease RseP (regulator of RpoE activity) [Nocardioides aurantiacus]
MTVLLFVLGVLVFVVGLLGSVALHEAGHLIPGKLFHVKVTQFMIGFGRTLWSRQRGETEYGLKAIPLGGYCKLVGMVPPNADEGATATMVRSRPTGMFAQLASDARDAEYEHVDAADHGRLFYDKPWWQRLVILGSGVAINLVLAFVLFAITFMGYGVYQATTTVSRVSECVIAVTAVTADQPQRDCTAEDPASPAREAGFRPGDRFVSINGEPVRTWRQTQQAIRGNGERTAAVVVERDGREVTLRPTTTVTTQVTDAEKPTEVSEVGFLGVVPTQERERQDLGYVVSVMADGTWQTLRTIGTLPARVWDAGQAALGLEERDPNGPMSVVGAGRVAGELASEDRVPALDRFFAIITLLAGLNLFLGLVNLVPLPPFDGGQMATTLYETVRRAFARLRRRPDPGGVDAAKLLPVTYVMASVILVVSLVLVVADVLAPITLS